MSETGDKTTTTTTTTTVTEPSTVVRGILQEISDVANRLLVIADRLAPLAEEAPDAAKS